MMKLNLCKLLAEDQLTPQQQRDIRAWFFFSISGDDNNLTLHYRLKGFGHEQVYPLNIQESQFKVNAYKQAMFYLINLGADLIKAQDSGLWEVVEKIISVDYFNHQFHRPLQTKSQDLFICLIGIKQLMESKTPKPEPQSVSIFREAVLSFKNLFD